VFITLKNGSHQVLPGIKVSLLRAEIPKREIGDVIGNVRIVEGITRIESTGKLLSDEEFAFLEESITRAQILKTMPDDELVDVRLLYAVGWVNRMTSGEKGLPYAKVWPVVSKAATVAEEFTSVDGKFKFEDVVGGLYYLSAEYTLNRSIIEWVVPVELSKVNNWIFTTTSQPCYSTWTANNPTAPAPPPVPSRAVGPAPALCSAPGRARPFPRYCRRSV